MTDHSQKQDVDSRIPLFSPGSSDTLLSASRANEIVMAVNALRSMVVKPDGAGKLIVGRSNVILELTAPASSGTVAVKMFKVQTSGGADGADYLTCKEWDGSAEVGSTLSVARPPWLRSASRPSSGHATTPAYSDGAIVFAVQPSGGTGVSSVAWIDLNVDARGWGYELQFCESGVAKKARFLCGAVSNA